jgi:uncharacterized membrane protein YbhN (UPF0104 family)
MHDTKISWRYFVPIVLLLVAGYTLLQLASPASVKATLLRVDVGTFLFALATYYISIPLRTYRWQLLLDELDVPLPLQSGSIFVGLSLFFNTLLPMKLGDAYKCQLLGKRYDVSRTSMLGTAILERVLDTIVLTIGIFLGVLFTTSRFSGTTGEILAVAVAVTVVVLGVFALSLVPTAFFPHRLQNLFAKLRTGMQSINSTETLVKVVSASILLWSFNVLRFEFILQSIGVSISLWEVVFVSLLVSFLTGLPYTPAGLGVVELVGTVALVTFGVGEADSVSIVVLDRLVTVGSVLATGLVLYLYLRVQDSVLLAGDPLS